MHNKNFVVVALMFSFLLPVGVERASALSCLPVDMYLKDVVGNEEIVIFEATSLDQIESEEHTAEVLKVNKALQGWVEDTIFVYHEKHPDWNYLCNSGPVGNGTTGIYVAHRNEQNQYSVHQRLEVSDPLAKQLKTDIEKAKIEGGISELTTTDRKNQIISVIQDLVKQITRLMKEHAYWSKG